ncbi:homoserine kinase [hydrocarbon metagenome]|uniref:Homoserine kinase n=1 Tax=hydrocarbon metagenome TaxID=938273 RepID=A0A0W8E7Q4_9ZZZZ
MIRVRAPATTANLGPGFDTLGMALELYLQVEAEFSQSGIEIVFSGARDRSIMESPQENLIYKAMNFVFRQARYSPTGLYIEIDNDIPIGKGLGSSAAAIVAGMYSANRLIGDPFLPAELLHWAVKMEGHADNIVPSITGGLAVAMVYEGEVYYQQVRPGGQLGVVVAVPDFILPTEQSRAVLPRNVPMQNAVWNLQRACFLLASLQNGDFSNLAKAMDDMIYQPFRKVFIPGFDQILQSAIEAGAMGVALSGAGPSILAFTAPGQEMDIGKAMQKAFNEVGVSAQVLYLKPDLLGVQYY